MIIIEGNEFIYALRKKYGDRDDIYRIFQLLKSHFHPYRKSNFSGLFVLVKVKEIMYQNII